MKSVSEQWLILVAAVSLALITGMLIAALPAPANAASRPPDVRGDPFAPRYLAAVVCTLSVTTTDSLESLGIYNDTAVQAFSATPPGRSGLALAPGKKDQSVTAKDDWFRLDNTTPGATYLIEAVPEATNNYNLGLIVYNASLTAIITDSNPTDNYQAQVSLVATGIGPYYFKVFQIPATACSGRTYKLNLTVTPPPAPDSYEGTAGNNAMATAYAFPVGTSGSATGANFVPPPSTTPPDVDWYKFYVKHARYYRASTSNLSNADTFVEIYQEGGTTPVASDNDGGGGFASKVEWQAACSGGAEGCYYYVRVTNRITTQGSYDLSVEELSSAGTDPYEPNDTKDSAYVFPVATSASATRANFVPPTTDQDWFAFYVKSGRSYRAYTTNLSGVDTYLEVFNESLQRIASDNDGGGGFASRIEWQAVYNGYYYIRVTNMVGTSKPSDTYDLMIAEVSSATPTPGASPSSPNADRCDRTELGNYDFDHACIIAANQSENLNFVPPPYGGPDNDFFKMWVKPGLLYECKTSDLSPGVDPNMIMYDHNRNTIAGNDDVERGNLNSYLAYYATYEGWLYILIGYGNRTPPSISDSNYTLLCEVKAPGKATATPAPAPTATSQPAAPPTSPPPAPTAAPPPGLAVRPLTTPTPVPVTTPSPRFVPIKIIVYYDANDDGQPGAGEGIGGVSAQAYEAATNRLLAQGFTNDLGSLEFTVSAQGPVRVRIPFFGFNQLVGVEGANIHLRVPPTPRASGGTP
ncbi:MAG: PPC domain-containing protein [Anaerolineae bacterium]|nr:PPC domain-containing protein [Anaerolineae bacterium]